MKQHSHVKGVSCPYCDNLADIGRDAINCKTCGAYAVHQGGGMYKWHQQGMMGQLVKFYKW